MNFHTDDISIHYELHGTPGKPVVVLISGLGGTGASWGSQVERFAAHYRVVLPDQRGTGKTTHAAGGYTTPRLAADVAALLEHLDLGPAHVVGSSTGGAIAQWLALSHSHAVKTLTLASSFARMDSYMQREMRLRRTLLADADPHTIYNCYALFLFSPQFTDEHPDVVARWVERCVGAPLEREIGLSRLDMILAHDALARLGDIAKPTLVLCGDHDACTPPHVSRELARGIPGAELALLPGGHMLHDEQPVAFFDTVHEFLS